MTEEFITELVEEIRADYQIPPYLDSEVIARSARICAARLSQLKEDAKFDDTDLVGRGLLKNYAYYDLYHRTEEFERNYRPNILSWQLSGISENPKDEEETEGGNDASGT